jgi:hypothetical protein
MICKACGAQNDGNNKYCINCGKELAIKNNIKLPSSSSNTPGIHEKRTKFYLFGIVGGIIAIFLITIFIGKIYVKPGENSIDIKEVLPSAQIKGKLSPIPSKMVEKVEADESLSDKPVTKVTTEETSEESIYVSIGEYSDGLAPVYIGSEWGYRWGYIDTSGQLIIPTQYLDAKPFSEGLAPVQSENNKKWGYIDTSGQYIIEPQFDNAELFSEGLAIVELKDQGKGYIDVNGNFVVEPRDYLRMDNFHEGVAVVSVKEFMSESPYHGIVDKTGTFLLEPGPFVLGEFSEGLVSRIFYQGGKCEFIDRNGKTVIESNFIQAGAFSEGLAAVDSLNAGWGYIDKTGNFVIPPNYKFANDFVDGLAIISLDGENWGYIDPTGALLVEPQFEEVRIFSEGLAAVKKNGKWGFINKNGDMVIPPQFFGVNDFRNGKTCVFFEDYSSSIIDSKGNVIENKALSCYK